MREYEDAQGGSRLDHNNGEYINKLLDGVRGLEFIRGTIFVSTFNQPLYENCLEPAMSLQEKLKRREKVQKMVEGIEDMDPDVRIETLKFRAEIIKREEKRAIDRQRFNELVEGVIIDFDRVINDPPPANPVMISKYVSTKESGESVQDIPYPETKGKPIAHGELARLEKIFEGFEIDLTLPEPGQIKPTDMKLLPPGKAVVIDENQITKPKNRREKRLLKKEKRGKRKVSGRLLSDMDPLLLDPMMDPKIVKAARERERKITREILEFNILLEGVDINLGDNKRDLNEKINIEYNI